MSEYRNNLIDFIQNQNFKYKVDIESNPSFSWRVNEVEQMLRQVIFATNKYYLLKSFPKWKKEKKFWGMFFQEGSERFNNIHYHGLLHFPQERKKNNIGNTTIQFMQMQWNKVTSINPITGNKKKYREYRNKGLPCDDLEYQHPLRIERVRDIADVSKYVTKSIFNNDFDDKKIMIVGLDDMSNPIVKKRRKSQKVLVS